jgi:AraC-like DNA-binding protein
MTIQLRLQKEEDWFLPGSPQDRRLLHSDSSDRILVCPSALGQGYRQEIRLRDDLSLFILDYTLNQDVIIDAPDSSDRLEFEFQLAGSNPGHSFFVPYFGLKNIYIKPAHKRLFKVEVFFKRPALATYFQACVERLSPPTQEIAENVLQSVHWYQGKCSVSTTMRRLKQISQASRFRYAHASLEQILTDTLYTDAIVLNYATRSLMTAEMREIIGQILTCPYQGANRRTYLECKALELVSLHLQALIKSSLSETNFDYIHESASILRKQLTNPPSVEALARQVGTNRLKLNQGFHQVYGTTPFGYLRDCRVRQARKLLMTSELSVSDVANGVGYSSRSRFATAFRQQFGINPKMFQMQAWQLAS